MQTKKVITLLPGLTVQGKSTTALPLFEMDYNTSNGLVANNGWRHSNKNPVKYIATGFFC